jgi:uncharacterized membrane protein
MDIGGQHSEMSEKSRIRTFSDNVFGLVVVFSAFSLTSSLAQTPADVVSSIGLFALSFAILITVWRIYESLMSKLRTETRTTLGLNVILLFLAVLQPYLLNIVISRPNIFDFTSVLYAIDMAGLLGVCALFAHVLVTDGRNALSEQESKSYKSARKWYTISAGIFLVSAAPLLMTSTILGQSLRVWLWIATLLISPIRLVITHR